MRGGVDILKPKNTWGTVMNDVFNNRDVGLFRQLLDTDPSLLTRVVTNQRTLLHVCVILNIPELVKELIQRGVDPTATTDQWNDTPFHVACFYEYKDILQIFYPVISTARLKFYCFDDDHHRAKYVRQACCDELRQRTVTGE